MKAILALAAKDLKVLYRDKFALFWILAFPLMYALFFGAIFGGDDDDEGGTISIAIVDEDQSDGSRALFATLAASESLSLPRASEAADAPLKTFTLESARDSVRKGELVAYLHIPARYGENPFAVFGGDEDQPRLELGIDPGRRAEAGILQGIVMQATFSALKERFQDKEVLRSDLASVREEIARAEDLSAGQKVVLQALLGSLGTFVDDFDFESVEQAGGGSKGGFGQPFEVVDVSRERGNRPRSSFEITFPQAFVWGLMSVAMGFAITLVRERTSGTLLRLRVAPIGRGELLAGKGVACFAACLATMLLLLVFGTVALGVRFDSLPLLALAMVCTALCFTGMMMISSVLGKSEAAVAGSSWGLMMPFAMIGGGMIPLFAMPSWLVTLSNFSPFKWAILSIEGAIWRGFDLADMWKPCAILCAIGVTLFALGVYVFRKIEG